MQLTVTLTNQATIIHSLDQQLMLTIQTTGEPDMTDCLALIQDSKSKWQLVEEELPKKYQKCVLIKATEYEQKILARCLTNEFFEGNHVIPRNLIKDYQSLCQQINQILQAFAIELTAKPKKATSAKAQHRWQKALAEIPFYVDDFGAKATIYWQKRNELRIEKGARLLPDAPLNKDGSLGFGARFALTLREEQKEKIKDNQTIEDIVLKSVNEVGHLLYFAGTNSWLVLKDANGKTIDEYSRVE